MTTLSIRPAVSTDLEFVISLMEEALGPYYGGDHRTHAQRIFDTHVSGGTDRLGFFSVEPPERAPRCAKNGSPARDLEQGSERGHRRFPLVLGPFLGWTIAPSNEANPRLLSFNYFATIAIRLAVRRVRLALTESAALSHPGPDIAIRCSPRDHCRCDEASGARSRTRPTDSMKPLNCILGLPSTECGRFEHPIMIRTLETLA
jgi:hypothetical protein